MHRKLETKFTQMIKGLAVLMIMKSLLELCSVHFVRLFERFASCSPLAVIVIFQPEIRTLLQYLGKRAHKKQRRSVDEEFLVSLKNALLHMSKRRIGALITLERNIDLEEFVLTGTRINAEFTEELLMNIFTPYAPLHDGAVILKGSRIVAAGTYLPLTKSELPSKYGTRHRASLGMSEANDSLTIVVSEETGEVGVAFEGVFMDSLTIDMCLEVVRREMMWI